MSIEVQESVTEKTLRDFGLVLAVFVPALFGLVIPWLAESEYPVWPWVFAVVFAGIALIRPIFLRLIYKYWMRLGLLISRVTTPLIMGIVFYVVVTPFGLIMRLLGKDPMRQKFSESESYRILSKPRDSEDLQRPF